MMRIPCHQPGFICYRITAKHQNTSLVDRKPSNRNARRRVEGPRRALPPPHGIQTISARKAARGSSRRRFSTRTCSSCRHAPASTRRPLSPASARAAQHPTRRARRKPCDKEPAHRETVAGDAIQPIHEGDVIHRSETTTEDKLLPPRYRELRKARTVRNHSESRNPTAPLL